MNRLLPSFTEEKLLWDEGIELVTGVDEVGRGAFAGPVVAAGVVFDKSCLDFYLNKTHWLSSFLHSINDSKKLTPRIREDLSEMIQAHCLHFAIAEVGVSVINRVGIGKANEMAIRKAVSSILYKVSGIKTDKNRNIRNTRYKIPNTNSIVLIDGFRIKRIRAVGLKRQKAIIKGDQKSISIAAASIIAKVYRDNIMRQLALKYPEYGFDVHKGYGTKRHQEAIFQFGLSKIHRTSFDLKQFLPPAD